MKKYIGAVIMAIALLIVVGVVVYRTSTSADAAARNEMVVTMTWLEAIWTLCMVVMGTIWGLTLIEHIRKWMIRKRTGENGILGLLIIKKLLLSAYKTTWSTVFGLIGIGFIFTSESQADADTRALLRALMGIAFIGWAVTGGLEALADAKLENDIKDRLDEQEQREADKDVRLEEGRVDREGREEEVASA